MMFFFFNDTATTEIYTLSLHDALPILFVDQTVVNVALPALRADLGASLADQQWVVAAYLLLLAALILVDRKSTRLNSSHANISYAVFCLKKNSNNKLLCNATNTHSTTL